MDTWDGCIEWDGQYLDATTICDGSTWEFTYLRTDEAGEYDFWGIRVAGDGSNCLTVEQNAPLVLPCVEGAAQEWRTAAS